MKRKSKKVNPRNKPVSEADVTRALDAGTNLCMKLVLFVLREKMDMDDKFIADFNQKFKIQYELINEGYISDKDLSEIMRREYPDMVEILRREHEIEV